ncbi:MAG: hypothetical protein BWY04_01283 [candidate division CPR1 bacterium ADurb.Bin160]|uniref:Uncharacterized protein n=1 Tax=candidate division CPR1 bacterium ADurb.Bin160 TaxID=1852826 RepID=A0A1V5ZKH6_9BACT|nr:MAG: hypothetical protein BWY04_01283 [candidate division CPR1 bacterium ADurb.Bin160]
MNDKWFNISVIIILASILANGLVFMITDFPGGNSFNNLHSTDLDYSATKTNYAETINTEASINSTATNYDGSGFIPILLGGLAAGLVGVTMVIKAVAGLEVLMLKIATIFTMFSVVIYTLVAIMFIVKAIAIGYLGSILVRLIFGGRQ